MARKKQGETPSGAPAWMTTYSDLVTLLLCFFVMLYASSNVDVDKFQSIAASFRGGTPSILPSSSDSAMAINTMLGSGIMEMPTPDYSSRENRGKYEDAMRELSDMASNFKTYFAENQLSNDISVELASTYVKLTFNDGILFDKGSAELKPSVLDTLAMVGDELNSYTFNDITVEGHADSDPINTFLYKDNLALSTARANEVMRYFIQKVGIEPQRISSQGFGEYWPIAPNDTEENKTKNRRVEIKIMSNALTDNE